MIYKEIYYIQQQEMVFLIFEFLLKNGININEPQKDGSHYYMELLFIIKKLLFNYYLNMEQKQI